MGLDAFVRCRCYQDGLVAAPADLEPYIDADDEFLCLDLPYDGYEEAHQRFDDWMASECEHPDMEYASEYLSNWAGYRLFQNALERAGWHHFPVLKEYLPESNGGQLPEDLAEEALEELLVFQALPRLGEDFRLVESASGKILWRGVDVYDGIFIWAKEREYGISRKGFFVRLRASQKVVFRSNDFTQEVVDGRATYRCRETGVTYQDAEPLGEPEGDHYPGNFHLEPFQHRPEDFLYIVEPLERILTASLETGNPVCWC